jgi:hypothetical protein
MTRMPGAFERALPADYCKGRRKECVRQVYKMNMSVLQYRLGDAPFSVRSSHIAG